MTDFYLDQLRDVETYPAPNLSLSPATVVLCQAALIPAEERFNWVQDLEDIDDFEWAEAERFLFAAIDELSGIVPVWGIYVDHASGGTWHIEWASRKLRVYADNVVDGDRLYLIKRVNVNLTGAHYVRWHWVSSGPLFSTIFQLQDENRISLYSQGTGNQTEHQGDYSVGVSGTAYFIELRVIARANMVGAYVEFEFLELYLP